MTPIKTPARIQATLLLLLSHMKKYNLSDIFFYQNYLVVTFADGAWEVMCSRYYFGAHGVTPDARSAVAAAKARVDVWLFG